MVKKVLLWGGLFFLLFFIAYRPGEARDLLYGVGGGFMDVARGLGEFFGSLVP